MVLSPGHVPPDLTDRRTPVRPWHRALRRRCRRCTAGLHRCHSVTTWT